jgi:drug/metabolite transporter (DMT)-like permease
VAAPGLCYGAFQLFPGVVDAILPACPHLLCSILAVPSWFIVFAYLYHALDHSNLEAPWQAYQTCSRGSIAARKAAERGKRVKLILIVLANVLLLVSGQVLWKLSLSRTPLQSMDNLLTVFLQPYLLLGCVLYGVATVLWFYALSHYDLSRVYPLQSIAYVLGALSGLVLFKEAMSYQQWFGLILLSSGAYLLAR